MISPPSLLIPGRFGPVSGISVRRSISRTCSAAAAFADPLLVGSVIHIAGNQHVGMIVVVALMLIGFVLMLRTPEAQGGRFRAVGIGTALAVLVGLGGCCIPKHPIASARLLREIAAGEEAIAPARRTPQPRAEAITYTTEGRRHAGDLYLPPGRPPEAGIVLVPGMAEEGGRDRRLVEFARALARPARFAVLVPDIPNLRELKVRPEDSRQISDAFRHLVSRRSWRRTGGRASRR